MTRSLEELTEYFNNCPYARLLGMKLMELSRGYAKVALQVRPEFNNWAERTHGGLIMSLADQAFGNACNTLDRVYFAVQFNMNILSTPRVNDTLTAEARVIHAGKSLGLAEMEIRDSQGKLIATATGTVMGMEGK